MSALIESQPMHAFAAQMAAADGSQFMTLNLQKRKPIFKNYIHNNASILRREAQTSKLLGPADQHQRRKRAAFL